MTTTYTMPDVTVDRIGNMTVLPVLDDDYGGPVRYVPPKVTNYLDNKTGNHSFNSKRS